MKQQIQQPRKIESARRPAPQAAPRVRPRDVSQDSQDKPDNEGSSKQSAWNWRRALHFPIPGWTFAPLRLFLGVTFIYAGIQKLTDPQFFNPHAIGYIGKQIQGFAIGSPIHGVLLNVVLPHVAFWGGMIAWGELAIGLGALVGFLLRPAAFFGLVLSMTFFLSASWRVHPYFYGADIVFVFAWASMLLAGPLAGGWPAIDTWLAPQIYQRVPTERRSQAASALAFFLGIPVGASATGEALAEAPAPTQIARARGNGRAAQRSRYTAASATRRDFLRGAVVGGGVMLVVSWLWNVTHAATLPPAAAGTGATGATGGTSGAATGTSQIALVKDVPTNSSATFTLPSNGDPGVLVHLDNGKFVAFDATCTHQGCPVSYDPQSQLLYCPCHGAEFNPAQDAEVVQGPAPTPLTPVGITVDQSTGAITLN